MQRVMKAPAHAGPPLLRHPHNQLASKAGTRVLTRGYIYGVAPNGAMPTTAAVVIDNKPPVNGYTLPPGTGPILVADTDTYQGQPFNGPWFMNPDTMDGGSPCLVDTTTMSIISIQHGAGQYINSAGETLVTTHRHTGGTDSDGHVQPLPIDQAQLIMMPSALLSAGPTVSGVIAPTSSTAPVGASFTVTLGITVSDFSTPPSWLHSVIIRTRDHGSSDWRSEFRINPNTLTTAGAAMSLSKDFIIGVGDNADFGIAYLDYSGAISATVWPTLLGNFNDPLGDLLDSSAGTVLRARMDPSITGAIDASGNLIVGIAVGAGGAKIYSGTGAPTISGCPLGSKYYRTDAPDENSTEYTFTPSGWIGVVLRVI